MSAPAIGVPLFDRATWLIEEYKLLSQHYFHEDSQLLKAVTIYGTLSGALLAFIGSRLSTPGSVAAWIIPSIGIVICVAWFAALVRHREWRLYIEFRIKEIEKHLHQSWGDVEPLPLDIRTVRHWRDNAPRRRLHNFLYCVFREWSASKILLVLPFGFGVVWLIVLVWPGI